MPAKAPAMINITSDTSAYMPAMREHFTDGGGTFMVAEKSD
jgi:hypothetical protein